MSYVAKDNKDVDASAQPVKLHKIRITLTSRNVKSLEKMSNDLVSRSKDKNCLLYTSPSPRDGLLSRMPSSA